jgi:hypothetical protein
MGNQVSLVYWSDKAQKGEARELSLIYKITAAKTVVDQLNMPVLTAFDALSTQAQIDTFLGTTNEFLLAAFDATAMGTDAFAGIVAMNGQCKELVSWEVQSVLSTGVPDVTLKLDAVAALTASSLTSQAAKGADGNVAFRAILTGVDALTAGLILVKLVWKSK